MKLDDIDMERLRDAVRETTRSESNCVTVTTHDSEPVNSGWEIAELQDEVNMACGGTDVWGYIVTLANRHKEQTFVIVLSRRPR